MDLKVLCSVVLFWLLQVSSVHTAGVCRGYRHRHAPHRNRRSRPFRFQGPCNPNPCGSNAVCMDNAGSAECSCPAGYTGNPLVACVAVSDFPRCQSDSECEDYELCIVESSGMGFCMDVCVVEPCGTDALCTAMNHQRMCTCPAGLIGDPTVRCYIDPCTPNPCVANALCTDNAGTADCSCADGFTGNPDVACVPVGCGSTSECMDTEICSVASTCVDACSSLTPTCGNNAITVSENHNCNCMCPEGYTGNPDANCAPIGDPCTPNPCVANALCTDNAGTADCSCADGFTGDPDVACVPVGCQSNPECDDSEICSITDGIGTCVDACTAMTPTCGNNAITVPAGNACTCMCPEGFTGNPEANCAFIGGKGPD